MTQNILNAGSATDSFSITAGNDGTFVLQVGPVGSKVNALSFDATGKLVAGPIGTILQTLESPPYLTYTSTALVTPWDDTIPQITEGLEFMTLQITPRSATNRLRIEAGGLVGNSGSANKHTIHLHQDAIANALTAVGGTNNNNVDSMYWALSHEMVAGTLLAITLRLRIGADSGNVMLNGDSAGRKYGGVAGWRFRVTEIQA